MDQKEKFSADWTGRIIAIVCVVALVVAILMNRNSQQGGKATGKVPTAETLKSLGLEANDLLTEYVEFHQKVHVGSATFSSAVKTTAAAIKGEENIPFDQFYKKSVSIEAAWIKLAAKVNKIEFKSSLPVDEVAFLEALVDYVDSVLAAATKLKERQKLVLEISKGVDHPFSQLVKINSDYQNAMAVYVEKGGKLEKCWERAFE